MVLIPAVNQAKGCSYARFFVHMCTHMTAVTSPDKIISINNHRFHYQCVHMTVHMCSTKKRAAHVQQLCAGLHIRTRRQKYTDDSDSRLCCIATHAVPKKAVRYAVTGVYQDRTRWPTDRRSTTRVCSAAHHPTWWKARQRCSNDVTQQIERVYHDLPEKKIVSRLCARNCSTFEMSRCQPYHPSVQAQEGRQREDRPVVEDFCKGRC
jgi:hypothetical protein